jgi:hypothetical protein
MKQSKKARQASIRNINAWEDCQKSIWYLLGAGTVFIIWIIKEAIK